MNKIYKKTLNLNELKKIVKTLNLKEDPKREKHILYFFKCSDYTLTIFRNMTFLLQGKNIESFVKTFELQEQTQKGKPDNGGDAHSNNQSDPLVSIGSDEVGTGDLFGGIVVCAAYIKDCEKVEALGVDDSKKINDLRIEVLYHKLKELVDYQIFELSPLEYNELYQEHQNLNIIKTLGHIKAIEGLKTKLNQNDLDAMIDQFCPENKFSEYLKKLDLENSKHYFLETKAESNYLVVAVASIIARHYFVNQIKRLSESYGQRLPFGSNPNQIKKILVNLKPSHKKNLLKLHFKNH